jgi:hypothetical protein
MSSFLARSARGLLHGLLDPVLLQLLRLLAPQRAVQKGKGKNELYLIFLCIINLTLKRTVSRAVLDFWCHEWVDIGLNKQRAWFFIFKKFTLNLKKTFTYFFRLMRACVSLIILFAYFCHSCKSQVECNYAMILVDWLAAFMELRVVGAVLVIFLRRWHKI